MSKSKLNITFHNPNTDDEMAKAIAKIFVNNIAEKEMASYIAPILEKEFV